MAAKLKIQNVELARERAEALKIQQPPPPTPHTHQSGRDDSETNTLTTAAFTSSCPLQRNAESCGKKRRWWTQEHWVGEGGGRITMCKLENGGKPCNSCSKPRDPDIRL